VHPPDHVEQLDLDSVVHLLSFSRARDPSESPVPRGPAFRVEAVGRPSLPGPPRIHVRAEEGLVVQDRQQTRALLVQECSSRPTPQTRTTAPPRPEGERPTSRDCRCVSSGSSERSARSRSGPWSWVLLDATGPTRELMRIVTAKSSGMSRLGTVLGRQVQVSEPVVGTIANEQLPPSDYFRAGSS
jgi:hypothetical protein